MTRNEAINFLKVYRNEELYTEECRNAHEMAIEALQKEPCGDTGEISDGYHTFNQLYHQRAILFATIVNQNVDISWKSYKHSDGKYCFDSNGEWFIVGIDTPEGSYTYHYSKEYWDYFKCKELDCGKEWDGHTEEDVTRLLSLKQEPCDDCISRQAVLDINERYCGQMPGYVNHEIWKEIKALQSVTPLQKMGRWIKHDTGHSIYYDCSLCNCVAPCTETADKILWKMTNYCPDCGAKMQEVNG